MTLKLREKMVKIARQFVGMTETSRNQAKWIKPLWTATSYPSGHEERQPYCAAGCAWVLREWLKDPEVRGALQLAPENVEAWRCKSASCFRAPDSWESWARKRNLKVLPPDANFHTGDFIIYKHSHIEIYTGDADNGGIVAIGFNTSPGGSRDGDGCFEKPRARSTIRCGIRLLE